MTKYDEVAKLIEELYDAAEIYYQRLETPVITDEEFDAKISYLKEVSKDEKFTKLFEVGSKGFLLLEGDPSLGTRVEAEETVIHTRPMLSLDKAKDEEELVSFLKRSTAAGATNYKLQAKLDGFALMAKYSGGKLVILATRGTGTEGELVTYITEDPAVTVAGLPLTTTVVDELEVRGELFFTNEQFKNADQARYDNALKRLHEEIANTLAVIEKEVDPKRNAAREKKIERLNAKIAEAAADRFKNSRNAVVGIMKKAKLGVGYPVEFTYSTYGAFLNDNPIDLEALPEEFKTVDQITREQAPTVKLNNYVNVKELKAAVKAFGEVRKEFGIPTDGVVIKPSNEKEMLEKMGYTSHHPISQIAYKYPGTTTTTEIIAIHLTVGKTGRVTPTAQVKPADLDGITINNASCHNFNWMAERDIRVGSIVTIFRANDVIPQVGTVINNPEGATALAIPESCPECDETLIFDERDVYPPKTLNCPNQNCPSRDLFALKTAVGKNYLNIDGLAEATLLSLNKSGRIKTIADLYTLTLDELKVAGCGVSKAGNSRELGEKRASNILKHIELSKSLPLWRILSSLNIEHLSFSTAKALVKVFPTIESLQAASLDELSQIEGMGEIKAKKIFDGLVRRAPLIKELQSRGVLFTTTTTAQTAVTGSRLAELSFAISGEVPEGFRNRNEWVAWIEDNGGEFHSVPKATTSYMLGDPTSTSSKTLKALKLGIAFMTAQEFVERFMKDA